MALFPHFDNTAKSGLLSRRLMLCIDEFHSCQVPHRFSLHRECMEVMNMLMISAKKVV